MPGSSSTFRSVKAQRQERAGRGCMAAFFGIFLVVGVVAGFFLGRQVAKDMEVSSSWPRVEGTILSREVITNYDSDGDTHRPEFTFSYEFGGRQFIGKGYGVISVSSSTGWAQGIHDAHPEGSPVLLYVNPADPGEAYIRAGSWGGRAFILIPLIFVTVGAGGLYFSIRRGRASSSGAGPVLGKARPIATDRLAAFPDAPTTSTGVAFPVSLASDRVGVWGVVFAIIFGGIFAAVGVAVASEADGVGVETLFGGCFGSVGLIVIGVAVHGILKMLLTGKTSVELEHEPLVGGGRVRAILRHGGNNTLNKVEVALVCTERASYRQGTRRNTATHEAFSTVIHTAQGVASRPGQPYVAQLGFDLPEAPASFKGSNNEVSWSLKVTMEIPGRPDVNESFVFRVVPREAEVAHG